MDEELKNAAINTEGSWSSLFEKALKSNNSVDYFKSVYVPSPNSEEQGGNIFHLAAYHNNVAFFESALQSLPNDVVHSLLCDDEMGQNPIHVAASRGHNRILELLVEFYTTYRSSSMELKSEDPWKAQDEFSRPWVAQDESNGRMPLHYVLDLGFQDLALEILSVFDLETISTDEDNHGNGIGFLALKRGLSQFIRHTIFTKSVPFTFSTPTHSPPLIFFAPRCSDEVCQHMFRGFGHHNQPVIEYKDERSGDTLLHEWARIGKMCPFKMILERGNISSYSRERFTGQLSTKNKEGDNPLHVLAKSSYGDAVTKKIAEMLVDGFKRERPEDKRLPWFDGSKGGSPVRIAIAHHNQQLASYFLSLDGQRKQSDKYDDDLFFVALDNGKLEMAQQILDIAHKYELTRFLTLNNARTALHIAPKSTEHILRQLIENHVELISESDKWGETILHSWIKIGELWPFKYILTREDIKPEWKSSFISLLGKHDTKERNPLHLVVASEDITDIEQIVQLLLDAFRKEYPQQTMSLDLPWLHKDLRGRTPLAESIFNKREKLALCFLSWAKGTTLWRLIDIQGLDILFKAVEYNCHQVVNFILEWVYKHNLSDYLHSSSAGHNILHLAFKCTEENGRLMVERWPELINKTDKDGKTPLERASEMGAAWLVGLILEKDRSCIMKTPLAWVEACKNGHWSTVITFAEKSPYFRYFCYKHRNTPLHNLKGSSYKEYQQFLEHESIKELRNIQNSKGETPLHVAIRSKDKDLSELLLVRDDVDPTIKDNHNKTAMHLLKEMCDENEEWSEMCKVIGVVDPTLKTTYIQPKADLTEMRSTISVVAALLATITFTAGFTLPGGLNGDNGEAILAKKAAFLVFLVTDTYSMCCSMLILFCIIWSMVCDRNKARLLIDRSLVLLKQSLYGTLLAFMTGVYIVIQHKSLWAAIVVFVMCSLVVIAANRTILSQVLPRLIPAADYDYYRLVRWLRCWNRKEDKKQLQEATPLNNQSEVPPADSIV